MSIKRIYQAIYKNRRKILISNNVSTHLLLYFLFICAWIFFHFTVYCRWLRISLRIHNTIIILEKRLAKLLPLVIFTWLFSQILFHCYMCKVNIRPFFLFFKKCNLIIYMLFYNRPVPLTKISYFSKLLCSFTSFLKSVQ